MNSYAPQSLASRALAVAGAVVANVLVLGGMLGLFNTVSDDAMLAKAWTNSAPTPTAMAAPAVPAKERS